jgi:5S rRNA maturation endonuclease (ribonuclease M5)
MNDNAEILRELIESLEGRTIIVEGKKDADTLLGLGISSGQIVVLNKGQSLLETVEALQGEKDVAVLTDMDGEGKRLRHRLLKMFSQYGITEDAKPRELFAKLRVSSVEGLRLSGQEKSHSPAVLHAVQSFEQATWKD